MNDIHFLSSLQSFFMTSEKSQVCYCQSDRKGCVVCWYEWHCLLCSVFVAPPDICQIVW